MIMIVLSANTAVGQMNEPNDEDFDATALPITGAGSIILEEVLGDGVFGALDVDLFRFNIPLSTPPMRLTLDVVSSTPDLDPLLRLFGPIGQGHGFDYFNNDNRAADDRNPLIETWLLNPGVYLVGVSTASNPHYNVFSSGSGRPGPGGAYTLTIQIESIIPPFGTLELNDTVLLATFIGNDSFHVTGEFIGDNNQTYKDVDIYRIATQTAVRIDVKVLTEEIGSLLDPVVRVVNCEESKGNLRYLDNCLLGINDDQSADSKDAAASLAVGNAGDVYIMVSGSGNRRYDTTVLGSGEVGSVGAYELDVKVTTLDVVGPNEPNDSIPMATLVPIFIEGRPEVFIVDGFLGDGWLAPLQGDRDFFALRELETMRELQINLNTSSLNSELDPVVVVYDAGGNRIASVESHGGSRDLQLVIPVSCIPIVFDSASLYIMVMGTQQRPPDNPFRPLADDVVIQPHQLTGGPGSTGPYRLTISTGFAPTPSCVHEPDDQLSDATETGLIDEGVFMCTGGMLGDSLCEFPEDDIDMWSFDVVQTPARVTVEVSSCSVDALTSFTILIFNEAGETVASRGGGDLQESSTFLQASFRQSGRYFIGVAGSISFFDPLKVCSLRHFTISTGSYDLRISLQPNTSLAATARITQNLQVDTTSAPKLFATRLDDDFNQIDMLDPQDMTVIGSFSAPEELFSGAEGLAYDGTTLFYVGVERFPWIYFLDPNSGSVLEQYILWAGSGYYSDAVMLGGELFLLDYMNRQIHVVEPHSRSFSRSFHIDSDVITSIGGGLAALAGPNRLYVSDAFNTGSVLEVDPKLGQVIRVTNPPLSNCCVLSGQSTAGCDVQDCENIVCQSDLSCCDIEWDTECTDQANTICAVCNFRPTALAGAGTSRLFMSDWQTKMSTVFDRDGSTIDTPLNRSPIGSLASHATVGPFADFDFDGDIDLLDIGQFQRCFTGIESGLMLECHPGDQNNDMHVDLLDFSTLPKVTTGP